MNTTLNVGGVSDTFSSTTAANAPTDTTPNAFSFVDVTNVARSSVQTSNAVTISGIDTASPVSVVGGSYSINGQAFTSSAGILVNGNTVRVRHTASASAITQTNTTLTIGGVSDTYSSTTAAIIIPSDTTPDAFNFNDVTDVVLSTEQTSNSITISGIDAASPVSISSGSYSINGQAFTTAGATVQNGNTIRVKHTASASNVTTTDSTLTIGGVSDTFTSTTKSATQAPTPPTTGGGSLSLFSLLWLLSLSGGLGVRQRLYIMNRNAK